MNPDDIPNLSDRVDIISTEDERLKIVGEILSSDSSRSILKLLFNQSLSANEIAQKTEMSLPLVIHHLKKNAISSDHKDYKYWEKLKITRYEILYN